MCRDEKIEQIFLCVAYHSKIPVGLGKWWKTRGLCLDKKLETLKLMVDKGELTQKAFDQISVEERK